MRRAWAARERREALRFAHLLAVWTGGNAEDYVAPPLAEEDEADRPRPPDANGQKLLFHFLKGAAPEGFKN